MAIHRSASLRIALLVAAVSSAAAGADLVPKGGEFIAPSNSSQIEKQPWLAADDAGNFVLVYSRGDIFARVFDRDGVPLGPDILVNPTINHNTQDECYVTMDPVTGDFAVGWSDRFGNDGFNMGCAARFFRADGVPYGPEFFLNLHTDFSQFEPHLAFSPTGRVFAAWTDAGADGSAGVFARIFDRFGNAVTGEFLVNEPSTKTQIDPSVSCDRAGNFVVAYVDASGATGEPREVFVRLFDSNGNPKGPSVLVNSISAGMQRDPIVAMDGDGDFVVAFHDESAQDGSGFGIYARQFDANAAPKGLQFQVNQTTLGDQFDPHVAVDHAGNFLITWTDASGADTDVRGRRYDRTGAALTDEFGLGAGALHNQSEPKFAFSQSSERAVACWFDDASGDDYVRLFEVDVLGQTGVPQLGGAVQFPIDAVGLGGSPYLLLASFATAPGVPVGGGRVLPLAPDALFFYSALVPNGPVFQGFAGTLDASGKATPAFAIPNDPVALGLSLSFAAVTLTGPGGAVPELVTEALTITIE